LKQLKDKIFKILGILVFSRMNFVVKSKLEMKGKTSKWYQNKLKVEHRPRPIYDIQTSGDY